MAEKILDYKDYIPPKVNEIEDSYRTHILEDIRGIKFKFKHRVPSTKEVLEFRAATTKLADDGRTVRTDFVSGYDFISKGFNCIPANVPIEALTEESVKELVLGFCKRV